MNEVISAELDGRLRNIESMLKKLVNQNSDWVDIEETARLCDLNAKTIRNYIDTGKLSVPSEKHGKKRYFKREDIVKWNESRIFRIR
jgi:hypothetical protein